ncbi:MAG TPA: ATP-binding protein [Pyrinomonadaceae bacterium]|jgi:heavy metal sensor kinase
MFDSVRTRLTLWYVGVLALVIVAFALLTYFFTIRVLNHDTNMRLEEMSRNFTVALKAEEADEEEERNTEQIIVETTNEFRFRDYQFAVFANNGRLIASTVDFDIQENSASQKSFFSDLTNGDEKFRVYDSPVETGQNQYRLLVFHSLREQIRFENRLTRIFLISAPLVLLFAGFGGYFLTRKSLAPVIEMGEEAENISAKNLNERLSVKNERDELGKLAKVFNALLARLEASFEQQRRFMADASHELRTPLAIVRGESEVALTKDNRPAKDYQASLAVVHDESKRLTKIVEDLFTLARADAGQFRASFAPVYLDEIVGDCVRSIGVLAQKKQVNLDFSSDAEMPMSGDESLLRRLFLNLLDNAIKYNRDGGTVSVICLKNAESFLVEINDSGAGIPRSEQTHIFDRFYRVDKARSRSEETETSGAGLGLSIARWITEIHRGTIILVSSDAAGSVFAVEFPRQNYTDEQK